MWVRYTRSQQAHQHGYISRLYASALLTVRRRRVKGRVEGCMATGVGAATTNWWKSRDWTDGPGRYWDSECQSIYFDIVCLTTLRTSTNSGLLNDARSILWALSLCLNVRQYHAGSDLVHPSVHRRFFRSVCPLAGHPYTDEHCCIIKFVPTVAKPKECRNSLYGTVSNVCVCVCVCVRVCTGNGQWAVSGLIFITCECLHNSVTRCHFCAVNCEVHAHEYNSREVGSLISYRSLLNAIINELIWYKSSSGRLLVISRVNSICESFLDMMLNCIHIFIVTGSFLYWCVMKPASQRFFIHSCFYQLIFINLI